MTSSSQEWLRETGLGLDQSGFIAVNATLESCNSAGVFAAGDCAAVAEHPRPKSGVFAVRQGPPLLAGRWCPTGSSSAERALCSIVYPNEREMGIEEQIALPSPPKKKLVADRHPSHVFCLACIQQKHSNSIKPILPT